MATSMHGTVHKGFTIQIPVDQMSVGGARLWTRTLDRIARSGYLSYQEATQLSSRGWVDPVPDPTLPEKFLGYSRESNSGPLG